MRFLHGWSMQGLQDYLHEDVQAGDLVDISNAPAMLAAALCSHV